MTRGSEVDDAELLVHLLSQLEEGKFRRLFRKLIDDHTDPDGKSASLATPNSYVFGRSVTTGRFSSEGWFFQLAFLPHSMAQDDIVRPFFAEQLTQAVTDLVSLDVHPFGGKMWGEAVDAGFDPLYEPSSFVYYFVTNLNHPYLVRMSDDNDLSSIFAYGRQILSEKLAHLGGGSPVNFGTGAPATISAHRPEAVLAELVHLLNEPSEYMIIAREGSIRVVPATTHGLFFASSTAKETVGEAGSGLATSLCLSRADLHSETQDDALMLEAILNDPAASEADLQMFFESHTRLLLGLDGRYSEIRPHVCLIDKSGTKLVPDFLARVEDTNVWDLVELKLPSAKVVRPHREGPRLSAYAAKAIGQVLRYRGFFDYAENRRRFTRHFGTHGYEPALVVVLGRGMQSFHWAGVKARFPSVRIVPYDYLFERSRSCRQVLEDLGAP